MLRSERAEAPRADAAGAQRSADERVSSDADRHVGS
jgi:hypothetical protein